MKKLLVLLTAIVLATSLFACAPTTGGSAKVKCPACGYEFDVPTDPS